MKKVLYFTAFVVVILLSFLYFNNQKKSIKIGFIAGLSGKYSNLGHSLLQGINLAFEEEDFLINGKKIEIISKDDKQQEEFAKLAMKDFEDQNIDLIIGSGTSSMTKVVLDYTNENYEPIIFSASASSGEFSKRDDNFLRTQVAQVKENFELLSRYLIENNISNIYAVYDSKNKTYTKSYVDNFEDSFKSLGGKEFILQNEHVNDFSQIIEDIKSNEKIQAILIVANSIDTAKLVQYLKVNEIKKHLIGSSWSKGEKLIEDGGKYVENMIFLTSFNSNSKNKAYLDFVKNYKHKFKTQPSIFAAQAYEAAKIIVEVLKKDSNLKNFKKNLFKIKEFEGLQGKISFDKYGDIKRDYFLMKIKNEKYESIRSIK